MTSPSRRCPIHSEPDSDELHAWACPDDCEHFHTELERRIDDMKVTGNYTRVWTTGGIQWRQTYRNHHPVGEPEVWRRSPK